jgi:hypothetical protein
MNAYELANNLENKDRLWNVDENLMLKNCAMLRQQADRIAELEKVSKPVAWMDYLEHSDVYDLNVSGRGIPLYTAPQIKELSDEEIYEVLYSVDWAYDPVKFARAILKKASEK